MNDNFDPHRFKIVLNDRVLIDLPVWIGWAVFVVLLMIFLYLIVRT